MKTVTLGWDGLPTIALEGGYVLPREAELIINAKYYPNWPKETWTIDPETGEKLPMESPSFDVLQRHASRNNRGSGKGIFKRLRQMVQTIFGHQPFRGKAIQTFSSFGNKDFMTGIKNKSGGAREGAGRKLKYGEPVVRVTIQVPKSKLDTFKKLVEKTLKKWERKQP